MLFRSCSIALVSDEYEPRDSVNSLTAFALNSGVCLVPFAMVPSSPIELGEIRNKNQFISILDSLIGKNIFGIVSRNMRGEVPLWVLCNDLTIGQIYWFFQAQGSVVRGNIARSFTALYKDSHRHGEEITSM